MKKALFVSTCVLSCIQSLPVHAARQVFVQPAHAEPAHPIPVSRRIPVRQIPAVRQAGISDSVPADGLSDAELLRFARKKFPLIRRIFDDVETVQADMKGHEEIPDYFPHQVYSFVKDQRKFILESARVKFQNKMIAKGPEYFTVYKWAYNFYSNFGAQSFFTDAYRDQFAESVASQPNSVLYFAIYKQATLVAKNLRKFKSPQQFTDFANQVMSQPDPLNYLLTYSLAYQFAETHRKGHSVQTAYPWSDTEFKRHRFATAMASLNNPLKTWFKYEAKYRYYKEVRGWYWDSSCHAQTLNDIGVQKQ